MELGGLSDFVHRLMIRSRIFRLAICLALALLAVGLGGLSVQRKVQAFQPLGFETAARKGAFDVIAVKF